MNECLRLRVKDIDFDGLQLTLRDAKGEKDRVTLLPEAVVEPLSQHLAQVVVLLDQAVEKRLLSCPPNLLEGASPPR